MIRQMLVLVGVLVALPVSAQALPSSSETVSVFSSSSSEPAPAMPTEFGDTELEQVVRAAYTGASAFASAHGNYFARDGLFQPLRDAVAAELATQFEAVVVPAASAADLEAAKACLALPGAELRIVVNIYGDGISLVAITAQRAFAYDHDPHRSPDIAVIAASDCTKLQ